MQQTFGERPLFDPLDLLLFLEKTRRELAADTGGYGSISMAVHDVLPNDLEAEVNREDQEQGSFRLEVTKGHLLADVEYTCGADNPFQDHTKVMRRMIGAIQTPPYLDEMFLRQRGYVLYAMNTQFTFVGESGEGFLLQQWQKTEDSYRMKMREINRERTLTDIEVKFKPVTLDGKVTPFKSFDEKMQTTYQRSPERLLTYVSGPIM